MLYTRRGSFLGILRVVIFCQVGLKNKMNSRSIGFIFLFEMAENNTRKSLKMIRAEYLSSENAKLPGSMGHLVESHHSVQRDTSNVVSMGIIHDDQRPDRRVGGARFAALAIDSHHLTTIVCSASVGHCARAASRVHDSCR